jgi:tRNA threonylcarbamoyladenosine biosynthesis protein TsaE
MQQWDFTATSETDTDRLGQSLADHLPETVTVALQGTLGAGKTRLVQAFAAACGIDGHSVTSPTFVLCQPYRGARQLYHLDAYRVVDLDEFLELGVEEYFEGPGVTLIEWADRIASCLPVEFLEIDIEILGEQQRQFRITAHGPELEAVLEQIATDLQA